MITAGELKIITGMDSFTDFKKSVQQCNYFEVVDFVGNTTYTWRYQFKNKHGKIVKKLIDISFDELNDTAAKENLN
jgi:hypothetical protein